MYYPPAEVVISMQNVTKRFGKTVALNDLSFKVKKGQIHGFLGPNGAGKSTAIRVLLGLLKKDSGDMTIFGKDPWKDALEIHKNISYIPEM